MLIMSKWPVYILPVLLASVFIYLNAGLWQVEIARQSANKIYAKYRYDRDYSRKDAEKLAKLTINAIDKLPFAGLLELQVRANTILFINADDTAQGKNYLELIPWYNLALDYKPYNGYLWAALANVYSISGKRENEYYLALNSAFNYGSRDYNTMRLLATIGVRDWPHLKCEQMHQVVSLLDRLKDYDDVIISVRNTNLGLTAARKKYTQLLEKYQFNMAWARRQSGLCK